MKNYKSLNIKTKWFCNKFAKLFFIFLLLLIIISLFFLLKNSKIWNKINSIDKIKEIVEKGGAFSCLIFIILQILQTTILQIPSIVVTIAGMLIFGKWLAFLLSFVSIVLGSVIMFWIGRKGGKKLLNILLGDKKTNKLIQRITNCKYLFVLMMLFPFFPDDILCLVAGFTNMEFKFFLITNLVARFIGVGCTIFFGSGKIIPFYGWGLIAWGLILIFIVTLFYLSIKYQSKIDLTLKEMFNKRKK